MCRCFAGWPPSCRRSIFRNANIKTTGPTTTRHYTYASVRIFSKDGFASVLVSESHDGVRREEFMGASCVCVFACVHMHIRIRHISVGIVTGLQAGRTKNSWFDSLVGARNHPLLRRIHNGSWAQSDSYSLCTWVYFSEGGGEVDSERCWLLISL
jgi:hypothetical protein